MQILKFIGFALLILMPGCSTHVEGREQPRPSLVILDIGHQSTARGATSPDQTIDEYAFWCRYAGEVKADIEAAGYRCVIVNRGMAPAAKDLQEACAKADVLQLNHPDKGAVRYSSVHYPEHIGCGMVSADYAIATGARCMVFLHLNSVGRSWSTTPPTGLIICNRRHGRSLAERVCEAMQRDILDRPGGIPNGGKGIKVLPRYIGSQPRRMDERSGRSRNPRYCVRSRISQQPCSCGVHSPRFRGSSARPYHRRRSRGVVEVGGMMFSGLFNPEPLRPAPSIRQASDRGAPGASAREPGAGAR